MTNKYLEKYAFAPPVIALKAPEGLNAIVVIPVYNELHLTDTLLSLEACDLPRKPVEIILVINHAENTAESIKKRNAEVYQQTLEFSKRENLKFRYLIIRAFDLPEKDAGVGLARKIGMDFDLH